MLVGSLMFIAALSLVFSVIYSAVEIVTDARPENRRKRFMHLAPFVLIFAALSARDIPGAMTALTQEIPPPDAIGPILKSLSLAAILIYNTTIQGNRSGRVHGVRDISSRVVLTLLLIVFCTVMLGLAFALWGMQGWGFFLQTESHSASWVGTVAIFLMSFAAVYGTVFSFISGLPLRWVSMSSLIFYFLLFGNSPPAVVQGVLAQGDTSWADALRPYGLGLALVTAIIPITLYKESAIIRDARNRKGQKDSG